MATPFMVFVVPTPGPGGTPGPQWAQLVNTALQTIDSHDHTPGKGAPIAVGALTINQDLNFASFGIIDLNRLTFTPLGSPFTGTNIVSVVNGELFFNDGSGNQIQLTAGGGLNAASIGGIGGDYVGSGASMFYTSSTLTFSLTSAPGIPAALNLGNLLLTSPDGTNTVTITNPNSGSSYTLSLPDALPASTAFLNVSSSGAVNTWLRDTVSLEVTGSTLAVRNVIWDVRFTANGFYRVGEGVDGSVVLPFNFTIVNAYVASDGAGTSGTTEVDIQFQSAPSGAWTSIFSTTPKFTSTAAAGAYTQVLPTAPVQTGVTAPVLSATTLNAGGRIRMRLVSVMAGGSNLTAGLQLKVGA